MAEDYKKAFIDRTNKHIERVNKFAKIMGKSYPQHDADKFNELFDGYSLMNKKDVTKEEQAKIDNATYLHVLNNDHHCEHWCDPADIEGFSRENPTPHGCLDCSEMPEYALEEMCCDWCAMSEEFNNTPFEWFEKNKDVRWHFDEPQTEFILNTLHTLWDNKDRLEEKIVRVGSKWQVQSEKGRNLGTYDTKPEAEKRLQQVHYFKHMNEDLQDNVLDALDKEFGQEELYMWSTYILPNGHFLNPDNAQDYWDEVDEEPIYEHCDFEDWAYQKGYNLSDIYNNCIKMNVTYPYLSMPDKARPTQEQLNAIRKILGRKDLFEPEGKFYWYDIFPEEKVDSKGENLLAVYTPIGDELFDLDISSPDDIIKAINMAYIRGRFVSEALTEDSNYDWDSRTSYEYKTGEVNGDDIFDTTTLGGFSDLSQCIPGNKYYQYMIDEKNKKGEIKMLSPEEYYKICAAQFGTTPEDLKKGRSTPPEYIKALERVITIKKRKFPMPFIDYTEKGSQEGLHRMMAAGNLFGWDHKFPVLVIDWADKARHEKEVDDDRRWELERNIDRALENALLYTYTSTEEFQSQLQEELNNEINGRYSYEPDVKFTLHLDNPKSSITVDDVTVEFDTNRIEVDPDRSYDDIDIPELDDIEDIDLDERVLKNYLQK